MKNKDKNNITEQYENLTVADMNVEGMPWYKDPKTQKKTEELKSLSLTRKERKAMIKGAFSAMLPMFITGLLIFVAAFALVMLYFKILIG